MQERSNRAWVFTECWSSSHVFRSPKEELGFFRRRRVEGTVKKRQHKRLASSLAFPWEQKRVLARDPQVLPIVWCVVASRGLGDFVGRRGITFRTPERARPQSRFTKARSSQTSPIQRPKGSKKRKMLAPWFPTVWSTTKKGCAYPSSR